MTQNNSEKANEIIKPKKIEPKDWLTKKRVEDMIMLYGIDFETDWECMQLNEPSCDPTMTREKARIEAEKICKQLGIES